MVYASKKNIIWSFGSSEATTEEIRRLAGENFCLRSWPQREFPDFILESEDLPCLMCFTLNACREFQALPLNQISHLEIVPKLVLLEPGYTAADIEEALDYGLNDIIRPPLTEERLAVSLRRASEMAALHRDVLDMAREIYLEREILENKNDALDFLTTFLSGTVAPVDETEVLRVAYSSLRKLFPVLSLHAVLMQPNNEGNLDAELYIAAPKDHPLYSTWREILLDAATARNPGRSIHSGSTSFSLPGRQQCVPAPGDGHILKLPLVAYRQEEGLIVLLPGMERNISRDQALALDAALGHLALALRNARRFQEMHHMRSTAA